MRGGSLSPVETFLGCLSPVGLSSQLSVRGRGMSHVATCTLGGAFVSCRGFPGMSFLCGIQLSSECEREGHAPLAPWVGPHALGLLN